MIQRGHPTNPGFSLVEVTLALAIVAFGLIAIFGLLPGGLGLVRESAAEATASNVMGAVVLEVKAGALSPSTNAPVEILYDSDGLPVDAENGATYIARVQLLGISKPRLANIQILWPEANPVNWVETIVVLPDAPSIP